MGYLLRIFKTTNYLIAGCEVEELLGDEGDVVTVTTDDDFDDVDVLCTSTNPLPLVLPLGVGAITFDECCFTNSHRSPPANPSPGNTHSLTRHSGSPWLQAAKTLATFGWLGIFQD